MSAKVSSIHHWHHGPFSDCMFPEKIKKHTKGSDARVLDILLEVENLIYEVSDLASFA